MRHKELDERKLRFALAVSSGEAPATVARRLGYKFSQSGRLLRKPHVRAAIQVFKYAKPDLRLLLTAALEGCEP